MEATLIYAAIVIVLFAVSFYAKRRFGLLGLALAAGSLLSGIWSIEAELIVNILGFKSGSITSAVVSSILVILPAGVLLFHGLKYKSLFGRVIGATLFTILALAFITEPLSAVMTPDGIGGQAIDWLVANKSLVISGGLIFAVIDLFLTKPASSTEKKRKH